MTEQYTTKDGIPITFKELPFNENNDQRGWAVHKIEAYINDEKAGYINLSYIPREKWDSIYNGNVWKFRKLALGHYDVSDELINKNEDEAIAEDHFQKYGSVMGSKNAHYWMKSEKEKAIWEYKMYELYFVDKPIVDFIRTEEKFQRQRVAYALHQYGNEWLKNNFGIHLWLSYCRSDKAKCFYNSKLLELKKYKYKQKMTGGYRQTREYVAFNLKEYKIAQIKQPWEMTQQEFMDYHNTGYISSNAYKQYETIDGLKWLSKDQYPILYSTKDFGGHKIEFRKSGEKLKYTAHDPDGEISRDTNGLALMMSDDDVKAKGYPTEDLTIVAFDGDMAIGWASDEFGTDGVWVVNNYQKLGIGTYLLAELRKQHEVERKIGQMTNAGYEMAKSYHRQEIQKALEHGDLTPDKPRYEEIMKNYKDHKKNTANSLNWYKSALYRR